MYYTFLNQEDRNMSKKVYLTSDGYSYHTLELRCGRAWLREFSKKRIEERQPSLLRRWGRTVVS